MERSAAVLGIGWDVGGWMGSRQGVAVARLDTGSDKLSWVGRPATFALPRDRPSSPEWLLETAEIQRATDLLQTHRVVIAIDAPLGFPRNFCELLAGRPSCTGERGATWRPDTELENRLAYRATDRHVGHMARKPLSASFDRIGNCASVAMLHLRAWREEQGAVVRPMDSGPGVIEVIEVYPALVKGVPVARAPQSDGDLRGRERVNRALHPEFGAVLRRMEYPSEGVFSERRMESLGRDEPDAFDACICAVHALCFAANGAAMLPRLVGPEDVPEVRERDRELVGTEGWIYYAAEWLEEGEVR